MRSVHEMRRQTGLACNYDVGLTGVLACSRMCCLPCVFWRLAEGWEHDRPAVRLLAAGRRAGTWPACRAFAGGWPKGGNTAVLPEVFWRLAAGREHGRPAVRLLAAGHKAGAWTAQRIIQTVPPVPAYPRD